MTIDEVIDEVIDEAFERYGMFDARDKSAFGSGFIEGAASQSEWARRTIAWALIVGTIGGAAIGFAIGVLTAIFTG